MKPRTTWLARLGLAGACLFVIGCGGGDVPDPRSDAQAASGSAPGGGGGAAPAAAAAAAEGRCRRPSARRPTKPPPRRRRRPRPPEAERRRHAEGPAEGQGGFDDGRDAGAGDRTSPAPRPSPAGGGRAPPAGGSADAGPGGAGWRQRQRWLRAVRAAPAMPGGGMVPAAGWAAGLRRDAAAGTDPGRDGRDAAEMQQPDGVSRCKAQEARACGRPGGRPVAGGAGRCHDKSTTGPADSILADGAVRAFLSALKAKDADRLSEATALRALSSKRAAKNQEMFKKILEVCASRIPSSTTWPRSSTAIRSPARTRPRAPGRVDVVIQKSGENGGYFRRKVTARHEKKGWGVLDIGGRAGIQVDGPLAAKRPATRRSAMLRESCMRCADAAGLAQF